MPVPMAQFLSGGRTRSSGGQERAALRRTAPDAATAGRAAQDASAHPAAASPDRSADAHAQLLLEQAAHEAATQRSTRLRALHEAALAMAALKVDDPEAVGTLMVEIVRHAVGALNGRDGRLVLTEDAAWRDLIPEHGPADGYLLLDHHARLRRMQIRPDGATSHVLQTGQLVHIQDTLTDQHFGPYLQLVRHGIRSMVIVPLRLAGRVSGALSVTFEQPRDLLIGDREAVELFAAHAAAAVERVRLLQTERRRVCQAERLAATLAGVGAAPDLVSAFEALLRGAISLLAGTDGVAYLYGPEPGACLLQLNIGSDGRLMSHVNPPALRPEAFGFRIQAGDPSIIVDDLWALEPESSPGYSPLKQPRERSAVYVPIDAGGQRIGCLSVSHSEPRFFAAADLALAEALAAQAAAAIERARLDAERQEAVRAREDALEELARQAEELARREAEAKALRELDELKNELLSTISHELRTPLTVVHGYAQRLQAGARHFNAAAVERMASLMLSNSQQLVRLVQDLVDFARLGHGEVLVQPVRYDLVPQLLELLASFRHQTGGQRLVADLPPALPVYADGARVEQIVANLLDNALKYAPHGPIVLRARGSADTVLVEVEDEGPGIPPHEQSRVWEKLFRGTGVAGLNIVRGSGIGLAVVKALVEAQSGRVGLQSALGSGSRFWFELPIGPPGANAAAHPALRPGILKRLPDVTAS
ncbi:MAG TPA: GAF domain-containing sensor histidine kinase [Chloroflexota bacterium]|nr:GAF domain-containing sensor histidine kinase [Chloroflexota bacterium]